MFLDTMSSGDDDSRDRRRRQLWGRLRAAISAATGSTSASSGSSADHSGPVAFGLSEVLSSMVVPDWRPTDDVIVLACGDVPPTSVVVLVSASTARSRVVAAVPGSLSLDALHRGWEELPDVAPLSVELAAGDGGAAGPLESRSALHRLVTVAPCSAASAPSAAASRAHRMVVQTLRICSSAIVRSDGVDGPLVACHGSAVVAFPDEIALSLKDLVSHRADDGCGVDNTGNVRLWPCEELLAWLALTQLHDAVVGRCVVELGAGMCGT